MRCITIQTSQGRVVGAEWRSGGGNANQTGVETVETRNGRNAAFNSAADRGSRVRPCPSVRQSPPLKSVGSWKRRGGGGGMRRGKEQREPLFESSLRARSSSKLGFIFQRKRELRCHPSLHSWGPPRRAGTDVALLKYSGSLGSQKVIDGSAETPKNTCIRLRELAPAVRGIREVV